MSEGGGVDPTFGVVPEPGTRHNPGIQPEDVEQLLDHGATVVVPSLGMQRPTSRGPPHLKLLDGRWVAVHVAETTQAVEIYNELAVTQPVGDYSTPPADRWPDEAHRPLSGQMTKLAEAGRSKLLDLADDECCCAVQPVTAENCGHERQQREAKARPAEHSWGVVVSCRHADIITPTAPPLVILHAGAGCATKSRHRKDAANR